MNERTIQPTWGTVPRFKGVVAPALAILGAMGCGSKAEKQAYDPVGLGMISTDTPFYDDGETTMYEVKRPVSIPVITPTDAQRASLAAPLPPYTRTPWVTKDDVKVQVSWTLSNLDNEGHNVEILVDPWNEFARYVPAVNVGDEEVVPDLSGIDLLLRVEPLQRKSGIFTFDDMDELATDLATVQNILLLNPPPPPGTMAPPMGAGVNGLINHAFDIHNRSNDNDVLVQSYVPSNVAGLVGFDLGLRQYEKGTVAIEILVEVVDVAGNRVSPDAPLRIDGSMWITPDTTVSAPMAVVR